MINIAALLNLLDEQKIKRELNVELKNYTSFKIGGPAAVMIFPDSEKQIINAIDFCNQAELPFFILGKGSNLLVSDKGYRGVIIYTCSDSMQKIEQIDETTIKSQAGAGLSALCRFALECGLSGLEFAYGIPGSVGGAAYMNAGAYDGEMKDVIFRCDHITSAGELSYFENEALGFSYRKSVYSNSNHCITNVYVQLKKADKEEIQNKMSELIGRRKNKQPLEYPSGGSVFKRPVGAYASALIEKCGLKGVSVGGAQVSEKHSGFIINTGDATCQDVLQLIALVKKTVAGQTGYVLECEIKHIGEE